MRQRKGITQRKAAEFLDVEKQTVSNWETGRHPIAAAELLRLVVHYEADIGELLAIRAKPPKGARSSGDDPGPDQPEEPERKRRTG